MVTPKTELAIRCDGEALAPRVLEPGEYTIGSAPECEVRLERAGVAPRHALLTVNYDELFVEPLEGAEVRVNDRPVSGYTRLWPHQRVQCGSVTLEPHRQKSAPGTGDSLPPSALQLQRLLPPELHRDRRYDIGGELGQGGMGVVLDARDPALRRAVAMKVLLDQHAGDHLLRFIEEAQVTGQLEHPSIPPVHELGVDENGKPYYTMKRVHGQTLREVLDGLAAAERSQESEVRSQGAGGASSLTPDSCPLTPEALAAKYPLPALLTVFQKVCDAVAFAHEKRIIHRDLKPENIMLGRFGEVLVMDWGLAKVLDETVSADLARRSAVTSVRVEEGEVGHTMAGAVVGTPQYMAPEQARGEIETMDQRADIYALGAILYHLLALRPPVSGKDNGEIIGKVGRGEIEPLRGREGSPSVPKLSGAGGRKNQGTLGEAGSPAHQPPLFPSATSALPHIPGGRVPDSLAAVVRKAMALDPAARYRSVEDLQAEITAYQNGFATGAEHASFMKQIILLVRRNKGIFATGFTAWLLITALAAWFIIHLRASERETRRQAEIAKANEQKAQQNAQIAQANEKRAEANEQEAVAEKEKVRRALAKSALALAEAAFREADGPAMQAALDDVPADLRDANWSYLLDQSDTSIARVSTGTLMIRSVAAHPKLPGVFAVADDSKKITILEARTGVRLLQFDVDLGKVGAGGFYHLAISPDGERIAVGKSSSKTNPGGGIAIHNSLDGTKLLAWESTPVRKLEFSPDGRRLLQQGGNNHLNLWDVVSGKRLWTYQQDGTITRGVITPDGQQVLTTKAKSQFLLLKMEDGSESRMLGENVKGIGALAIRPDGLAVLWSDYFGHVYCSDFRDGRLVFSSRAHAATVKHLAFTPDGQRFASVTDLPDGRQSIQLSDAKSGAHMQSLVGGNGGANEIAMHPVSGELLIGGPNCRLWDITGTPSRWVLRAPTGGGTLGGAEFLGSDDLFLGPTAGHGVSLVDLRGPSTLWNRNDGGYRLSTTSADGRIIALGTPDKAGRIQVLRWQGEKVEEIGAYSTGGGIVALRLNASGDRLAVAATGTASRCSVLDPATGAQLVALDKKDLRGVNDLFWIGGGTQLIGLATANRPRGVAKSEERIIVWDASTGQRLRSVVHPTALDCLVVAPDGKSFAAAGADKLVHVFDTETLAERQAFRAHDGPITALAWHPSRPIVATGSADLTIKLWNLESGRRLETLRGPTAAPRVLNFSPSGQRLACGSEDRMVRIWEPQPLNNALLDAPAADGWEDLLAKLTTDEVKANGNGWTLSGGVLLNPNTRFATLPFGGSYARSSYQVRLTVRSLSRKSFIAAILPVADQQTAFIVDGSPEKSYATGLWTIDRKPAGDTPDAVRGQQIKDSEPHDLEITVRLSARTAQITATLDDRPLYEWSGPATSLGLATQWGSLPQPTLHLGASSADWVISAMKVKRLDAGK